MQSILSSKSFEAFAHARDTEHAVMDEFGSLSMESAAEMIGTVLVMALLIDIFKNIYTYLFKGALGAVKYWFCSQPIIGYLLGGWCSP